MNTMRLALIALCSAWIACVSLRAAEIPDEWTWDNEPAHRASHAALEGKPMPALSGLTEWINGTVTGADLKGKVVVVDLYATWCGPCLAAIPHNNEMLKRYKDKGLVIVGICSSSRGQEKMASVARKAETSSIPWLAMPPASWRKPGMSSTTPPMPWWIVRASSGLWASSPIRSKGS